MRCICLLLIAAARSRRLHASQTAVGNRTRRTSDRVEESKIRRPLCEAQRTKSLVFKTAKARLEMKLGSLSVIVIGQNGWKQSLWMQPSAECPAQFLTQKSWHHDTQHNTIHHNDTQHERFFAIRSIMTLRHLCWLLRFLLLLYAECHYAECHYAECHYAECRGATFIWWPRTKGKAWSHVASTFVNNSKDTTITQKNFLKQGIEDPRLAVGLH